ncbi:Hypothetical protein, putative [Bodo saltans]|uniref:Rhodanese domain-containing protein n=1 Tax=Bodo saltans TaxID=75058 RepID=A0A0S4JBQ9_BODSA|nr:Hypothetical protein, putative [Bodo saltans]|eukprot:CUG88830.1 Hypothetical protein, putative [Bodo saltans]
MSSSLEQLLQSSCSEDASSSSSSSPLERRQAILHAALSEQEDLDKLLRPNPHLRWELYAELSQLMLFNASSSFSGSKRDAAPTSFQAYSHAMNAEDEDFAATLLKVLSPQQRTTHQSEMQAKLEATADQEEEAESSVSGGLSSNEKEVRGFVYFFATKTGSSWSSGDGLAHAALSLAHLLAMSNNAKRATTTSAENDQQQQQRSCDDVVKQSLRQLFVTLYHFHATLLIPTQAQCFAHSFEILFRLLLQYHDPLLALHFDQRQVDVGVFAYRWIRDLLTVSRSSGGPPIVKPTAKSENAQRVKDDEEFSVRVWPLWDLIVVHQEPLLPCFLTVVALIECRQDILARCASTIDCQQFLSQFHVSHAYRRLSVSPSRRSTPSPTSSSPTTGSSGSVVPSFSILPPCERAKDLIVKAKLALRNTPLTSQVSLRELLFPDAEFLQRDPREVRELLLSFVALPVDSAELVAAFASPSTTDAATVDAAGSEVAVVQKRPSSQSSGHGTSVGYVILDCRSTESFHFARLPTALHVGDAIGFDAELLQKMRDRFAAARGSHLCILGTGRALIEEINLLKLIVLHLVQHGFPYVSVATGGFRALIPYIKSGKVEFVRGGGPKTKPHKADSSPQQTTRKTASCVPMAPTDDSDGSPALASRSAAQQPPPVATTSTVDEIKAKASSWGWGLMKAVTEKVDDLRRPKAAATSSGGDDAPITVTSSTTWESRTEPQQAVPPVATASASQHSLPNQVLEVRQPLFSTVSHKSVKAIPPSSTVTVHADPYQPNSQPSVQHPNQQAAAGRTSVVDADDDDEELDLITSVAPPPPPPPTTVVATPVKAESLAKEEAVVVTSPPATKPASSADDDLDFLYTSPPAARPAATAVTTTPSTAVATPSAAALQENKSESKPVAKPSTSRARSVQQAVDDFDDIFN